MSLTYQQIEGIFAKRKAIITNDHFVYAKKADGWKHGACYVNKDAIFPYVQDVQILCEAIASCWSNHKIEVVVGPTQGGSILAQWTASSLSRNTAREVLAVYADEEDVLEEGKKIGTKRVIKRGYDALVQDKHCLIVEDVINTGATISKVVAAIWEAGGRVVVGAGALCNRSGGKVTAQTLDVPELSSLLIIDMEMFPEDDCPICKQDGPQSVRTDLGKGKEFLQRKGLFGK